MYGFKVKKVKCKGKDCFEVWKLKTSSKNDDVELLLGLSDSATDIVEILTKYRYLKNLS